MSKRGRPDGAEAFPRGGGARPKQSEEGPAVPEVFGQRHGKKARTKSRSAFNDQEDDIVGLDAMAGKDKSYVELLKPRSLHKGMKLWGCVSEIARDTLIVSVPHGLRVHVDVEEVSDTLKDPDTANLTQLFSIGQLVRVAVLDVLVGERTKIIGSLKPSHQATGLTKNALRAGMVLPACVASIEGRGYVLSIGVDDCTAFLRYPDAQEAFGETDLLQGQLIDVLVEEPPGKKSTRVAQVVCAPSRVSETFLEDWGELTMTSLVPGALVNAKTVKILDDGLEMLFLDFFRGTVDPFHLAAPPATWKEAFPVGKSTPARILYVDPVSKRIGLTLLPSLLSFQPPVGLPSLGAIFEEAVVLRVDKNVGLLLQLAAGEGEAPALGFAHVSALSDKKVEKIEKVFKVGQAVRCRVTGYRPMDCLCTVSLKASVLAQTILSARELTVAAPITGVVKEVTPDVLFLELAPGVKAKVPSIHMSDTAPHRAHKKFKEGQHVSGLVLRLPKKHGGIATVTLKRSIIESKLPRITSLADIKEGTKSHGTVTSVKHFGLLVDFFGDVKGTVPTRALGLPDNQTAESVFEPGATVRARVTEVDAQRGRLRLSLTSADASTAASVSPRGVVTGVVTSLVVEKGAVKEVVLKDKAGGAVFRLPADHLSDHPVAVEALAEALKEGDELSDLLVLRIFGASGDAMVTRKPALVAAAASLPAEPSDLTPGLVVPGYVASVTTDSAFVRFLGELTGRAGRQQISGSARGATAASCQELVRVGQTVLARVEQADVAANRFPLSLRVKSTGAAATGGQLVLSMCRDLELAATLQAKHAAEEEERDEEDEEVPVELLSGTLAPGSLTSWTVGEKRDYGVILSSSLHDALIGLLPEGHYPPGGAPEEGDVVEAVVLHATRSQGLVEVSCKDDLVAAAKERGEGSGKKGKKRKVPADSPALEIGEKLAVRVELVKKGHAVVSTEVGRRVAMGATCNLNTMGSERQMKLAAGDVVEAEVVAEECAVTYGRAVVALTKKREEKEGERKGRAEKEKKEGKKAKKEEPAEDAGAGEVVTVTVMMVHPTQVEVKLPSGQVGRIHGSEIVDAIQGDTAPLESLKVGQKIECAVVGEVQRSRSKKVHALELTARPTALEMARKGQTVAFRYSIGSLAKGEVVEGYVQEVHDSFLWVSLSPVLRGRVHLLDSCSTPDELANYKTKFAPGVPVRCRVTDVSKDLRSLDLTLREGASTRDDPKEGDLVMGVVKKVEGSFAAISLGPRNVGRVNIADVDDAYCDRPLSRLSPGMFVACRVLRADEELRKIDLSLRQQHGGSWRGAKRESKVVRKDRVPLALDTSKLKPGDAVRGWISSVSKMGAFVALAGGQTGRIKLAHLSDSFVEDPASAFPVGTLVKGKVTDVDSQGRVGIDLRQGQVKVPGTRSLEEIEVGEVLWGAVKRVEKFGVFVVLDGTSCTGLAHISECADDFVRDLTQLFQVGKRVRAKVLKVDTSKGRLSLSVKPSVVGEAEADGGAGGEEDDIEDEIAEAAEKRKGRRGRADDDEEEEGEGEGEEGSESEGEDTSASISESDIDDAMEGGEEGGEEESGEEEEEEDESDDGDDSEGSDVEELDFEDVGMEESDGGERGGEGQEVTRGGGEEEGKEKKSKAAKRREREERERAVLLAEKKKAEGEAPASEAEFEALCMASPNSSYVWIRYMAWLLSKDEVAKAKKTAERALQTISMREEAEKFNVWVAYLNMEVQYEGAEEAMKLFQRALPYNDPKKLHFSMLDILEDKGEKELIEEVIKSTCKKFHDDPQAWLRSLKIRIREKDRDGARSVLEKAMRTLPKSKHVEMATQSALMEFREGSAERGRGIMEGILKSYPKRTDLWSVYLDQETKTGDVSRARALYERCTAMMLPPKKMKFLFKKYLEFERKNGDEARVEAVRAKAMEFVQRALSN